MPATRYGGPPMTLANMRENGVRAGDLRIGPVPPSNDRWKQGGVRVAFAPTLIRSVL
jgi:hypothetical protein